MKQVSSAKGESMDGETPNSSRWSRPAFGNQWTLIEMLDVLPQKTWKILRVNLLSRHNWSRLSGLPEGATTNLGVCHDEPWIPSVKIMGITWNHYFRVRDVGLQSTHHPLFQEGMGDHGRYPSRLAFWFESGHRPEGEGQRNGAKQTNAEQCGSCMRL